jgi:hypothetical protein
MEYLLLVYEFYATKRFYYILKVVLVPVMASFLVYNFILNINKINTEVLSGDLITLFGVLFGFTISFYAILFSSNSPNINEAKNTLIGKSILNKDFTIYDEIITGLAYSIVLECLLIILNIFTSVLHLEIFKFKILFSVNFGFLTHIILVLLRSVLSFYFCESKRIN